MEKEIIFKESVEFIDVENNLFKINVEIEKNTYLKTRRGWKTLQEIQSPHYQLSITGEHGQGYGQCLDNIKPANTWQEQLIELWREYHLNTCSAGTFKQETLLKQRTDKSISAEKYLEDNNLLIDNGYKYGSDWLYKQITPDLIEQIDEILANIENSERERIEKFAADNEITDYIISYALDKQHTLQTIIEKAEVTVHTAKQLLALGNANYKSIAYTIAGYQRRNYEYSNSLALEIDFYGYTYCVGTKDDYIDDIRNSRQEELKERWLEVVNDGDYEGSLQEFKYDQEKDIDYLYDTKGDGGKEVIIFDETYYIYQ